MGDVGPFLRDEFFDPARAFKTPNRVCGQLCLLDQGFNRNVSIRGMILNSRMARGLQHPCLGTHHRILAAALLILVVHKEDLHAVEVRASDGCVDVREETACFWSSVAACAGRQSTVVCVVKTQMRTNGGRIACKKCFTRGFILFSPSFPNKSSCALTAVRRSERISKPHWSCR